MNEQIHRSLNFICMWFGGRVVQLSVPGRTHADSSESASHRPRSTNDQEEPPIDPSIAWSTQQRARQRYPLTRKNCCEIAVLAQSYIKTLHR